MPLATANISPHFSSDANRMQRGGLNGFSRGLVRTAEWHARRARTTGDNDATRQPPLLRLMTHLQGL